MKDEKSARIIRIPQMILIHLANPLTLWDWMNRRIAHRVLVIMDKILIPKRMVINQPIHVLTLWMLLSSTIEMIMDPRIASSWTTAQMILITLANFLCFIASLNKRIAHRTDPAMRITPITSANVEIVTNGVVEAVIDIIMR